MKYLLLVAVCGLAVAQRHFEDPWQAGSFTDSTCLNVAEFTKMWGIFDLNTDGTITHLEFDTAYNRFEFQNKDHEDLFFLELDRVADEALTSADFQHIFKLFDIDASGCVDHSEFRRVWRSLVN